MIKPFDDIKSEVTWLVYKRYMTLLPAEDTGSLAGAIISILQPYYKIDLKEISVSYGKANDGGAITDCNHIRFPDADLVGRLKGTAALKLDNITLDWLLHELRHSDQCLSVGGRKEYGSMWFRELEATTNKYFLEWSAKAAVIGTPPNALIVAIVIDLLNGGTKRIHDAMPMEKDASDYARQIFANVRPSIPSP